MVTETPEQTLIDRVDSLFKVWYSGGVSRYHTLRSIEQSVASHSWGVAFLLSQLFPEARKELIILALTHDCSEAITGDLPATFKWFASEDTKKAFDQAQIAFNKKYLKNIILENEEYLQLKFCDYLECMFFCRFNLYALNKKECAKVLQNAYNYLATQLIPRFPEQQRLGLLTMLTLAQMPISETQLGFHHVQFQSEQ